MISDDVPASLVACLRCVTAMIPLYFMSRKHLKTKIDRKDWKYFFLVGALGYFLTVQMIQLGIALTGASMATLINAMTPVAVTILAAIILKEKITPVKCLCLVLALAGTIVITSGASTQERRWNCGSSGRSCVLCGVFRIYAQADGKVSGSTGDHLQYGHQLDFSYTGRYSDCLYPAGYDYSVWSGNNPVSWICGLRCGAVYLDKMSVHAALPAPVPLFYPLQPAFATLLGAWLLGETFTPAFFIGLMLISLDVVLNTWEARQMDKALTAKESSNA